MGLSAFWVFCLDSWGPEFTKHPSTPFTRAQGPRATQPWSLCHLHGDCLSAPTQPQALPSRGAQHHAQLSMDVMQARSTDITDLSYAKSKGLAGLLRLQGALEMI